MKEQWLAKTSKHKGYLSDWAARSHSSTCIKDMRDYQCHFETLINFISNTHKKNYKKNKTLLCPAEPILQASGESKHASI